MIVELLRKAQNTATINTIATYVLQDFPRILLAEFNTHNLARNTSSSRAIPIAKIIDQVRTDPYVPIWTSNKPGMVGEFLPADSPDSLMATQRWLVARDNAIDSAAELMHLGIHKQEANRILEPWMRCSIIATGTSKFWGNFFKLRNHEHAHPAFQPYAAEMERLWLDSTPDVLEPGEWYKPWKNLSIAENTAKAASISYSNHQKDRSVEDSIKLHDSLVVADPIHGSPLEHCAMAIVPGMHLGDGYQAFCHGDQEETVANCDPSKPFLSTTKFFGFIQYRTFIENGVIVDSLS